MRQGRASRPAARLTTVSTPSDSIARRMSSSKTQVRTTMGQRPERNAGIAFAMASPRSPASSRAYGSRKCASGRSLSMRPIERHPAGGVADVLDLGVGHCEAAKDYRRGVPCLTDNRCVKAVRVDASGDVAVVEDAGAFARPGRGADAHARLRDLRVGPARLVRRGGRPGSILGHEVAGELIAVGPGVTAFVARGPRRAAPPRAVPRLPPVRRGPVRALCRSGAPRGWIPAAWPSGCGSRPATSRATRSGFPTALSDEEASFTEPLATVVKAFRRGRFAKGQSILCVGLGPAGQLALASGPRARRVPRGRRRPRVLAPGRWPGPAAPTPRSTSIGEGLAAGARRLTGGAGFDFVFVGPGKAAVIREAAEAVAAGGTLLLFTMAPPGESWPARSTSSTSGRSRSCRPTPAARTTRARPWSFVASGRVAVSDLVSHRFAFAEAPAAFARAREPEGSMKVVFRAD